MTGGLIGNTRLAAAVWGLLLALAYFAAAKLGLALASATPSVTAVWAPTGIALAALVLGGRRLWPGVALGAFLANVTTDVPLYTAVGITVGNTLEAVVGAWLLERVGFRPSFRRLRDILTLAALGAVVSTAISATIGIASLSAGDAVSGDALSAWRVWWLGDMCGDLLVAPLIFVLVTHWPYRNLPGNVAEAVVLLVALVATSLIVFTNEPPVAYVIFPLLVWAAVRFLQPGATVAAVLVAAAAVIFTANDSGPFVRASQDDSLLLAQSFSAVTGVTALFLAVLTDQRRRAERRAQRLAHDLQAELLPPQLPDIPQFEVSGWYRAGVQEQEAGGDFYDVFETSPGHWLAVIGDVCGKGPVAASLTALARYTLRAVGGDLTEPSQALQALNDAMLEQRSDNRFMTVVLARLDVTNGGHRLVLSNGGHPLPLMVRAGGDVEEVTCSGTLLGMYPDPELIDQVVELAPGDALVFFTDGLIERRESDRDSAARLQMLLAGRPAASADEIAAHLREMALPRQGGADDDVAVVVLRRVGPEASA